MSASKHTDGQYAQRHYRLEESITTTDGARTTFIEYMTPGTRVPPHYHNQFSETFDLISGPMTVFSSTQSLEEEPDLTTLEESSQQVKIGEKVTVNPAVYHYYVVGNDNAVLRCILSPGHAGFEQLLKVLDGLTEDGKLEEMSANPLLMSIIMDLSDAHLLGPAKEALDKVRGENPEAIQVMRKELLEKYDTQEALERLMAKD